MSRRTTLEVEMRLESDAIPGTGYSIPGGEDIAVCRDGSGRPFIRGTVLKGLLREELGNELCWSGRTDGDRVLGSLLGEGGRRRIDEARRLTFTDLTLKDKARSPEDCFTTRMFTSINDRGVVQNGSLRMAACVRRGLVLTGEIDCEEDDANLVCTALENIKWMGRSRGRGFGQVKVTARAAETPRREWRIPPETRWIRYRLRSELPIRITDLAHSSRNSYDTRGYLPGSALRGMVMGLLSRDEKWFNENKKVLLTGVGFLDAVPTVGDLVPLPSIKGFYEDKAQTGLETVVVDGVFSPGSKRAGLGSFCAPQGNTLKYWSARTDGSARIYRHMSDRKNTEPFNSRYLDAGQEFEGYIRLEADIPGLRERLEELFSRPVWLGADRYEGFGKCTVTLLEGAEEPRWRQRYGGTGQPGKDLYLLAVSPFTMLSDVGEPAGLNEAALAQKLGVETVTLAYCATGTLEMGGYNRMWGCREAGSLMYDRGSIFHLVCSEAPSREKVEALQREGLGIRRAEGYGEILFLSPAILTALGRKEQVKLPGPDEGQLDRQSALRRARYRWLMT